MTSDFSDDGVLLAGHVFGPLVDRFYDGPSILKSIYAAAGSPRRFPSSGSIDALLHTCQVCPAVYLLVSTIVSWTASLRSPRLVLRDLWRSHRLASSRMQFCEFLEPLVPDVRDLCSRTFQASWDCATRRARDLWLRKGHAPARCVLEGLTQGAARRLCGVGDDDTLVIGAIRPDGAGPWGPGTRSSTAQRLAEILPYCPGTQCLRLHGQSGAALVHALPIRGIDMDDGPSRLVLGGVAVRQLPPIGRLPELRSVRINSLRTDVTSSLLPCVLNELSSLQHLSELEIDDLIIDAPSAAERRQMLSAEYRNIPTMLFHGLGSLHLLEKLKLQYHKLESRCATGLARAMTGLTNLTELHLVDRGTNGSVAIRTPLLPKLLKLNIVTDDVSTIGSLATLTSLTVTSIDPPPGYLCGLAAELSRATSLDALEIRVPKRAWRETSGIGDLAGLDELVLASRPDMALMEQHVGGPGRWIAHAIVPVSPTPSMSRPRTITVGTNALPRAGSASVHAADEFCEVIVASGVRESVKFIGPDGERVVSVSDMREFVHGWTQGAHLLQPHGLPQIR